MSNVIQFLESLGNSATRLSAADYAAAIADLNVEPPQRNALLDRDVATLSGLLEARATMFCMIATPDGGETQDIPESEEEPDSKEPEAE